MNYVQKTCGGQIQSVYGVYVIKAYEDIIFRKVKNEPFKDDTIYVVKQFRWQDTYYTLLHELLHWVAVKTLGIKRSRKLNKLIDKYLP